MNKCRHKWLSNDASKVGGCKENPGVWCSGEWMTFAKCCDKCGLIKRWQYNICNGRETKPEYLRNVSLDTLNGVVK